MTDTINKTLIIRFSSVGDIVLSSLLVRTFRARFPECQLDYVVKEEFADVLRFNPHLTNVLTFPRLGSFNDLRRLRRKIHDTGYDLVIDIHGSWRSRYLSCGARRVVRINKRKFARLLLVKFKRDLYSVLGGAPSVALRYLETVQEFGIQDDSKGLEIFVGNDESVRTKLAVQISEMVGAQQFVGVCPSAKHNTKMWPWEKFAEAAVEIARDFRVPIILFGSQDERERCDMIKARIAAIDPALRVGNLAGKISLLETAAVMDRCEVVLTNDSGLMHIAAARKRPVVAIFGSTVRQLGFFPFGTASKIVENAGLYCRPCTHIGRSKCPEQHFRCMLDVPVADVVQAVNSLHLAKA